MSAQCRTLLERCAREEVFGVTTVEVINEVTQRLMLAIASWSLALNRWKELNDFQRHGGAHTKAPIARQAFSAVPLRAFDLLWRERDYAGSVEKLERVDLNPYRSVAGRTGREGT